MKIDNSGKPLGSVLSRSEARTSTKAESGESAGAEPGRDSVEINAFSARLASLESNLATQPVIDESKVAEIRQAIAEGRFTVHADAIADKLMASVKELLGKN
ncbi:flagellar biosynthesis anti-sigma factor FlgM [Chitinimonas viridis]|uniref:Negative regulator of flagellin synthesis n=1 Tax=Chitinimonas viridis TaxID=664880 RepID=A0ABT8B3B6_9NEIS|nr:flagellar biosynthesis anti-sigma factor FlgM [Chitinimonas viridis]MBL8508077.1 flagellar biosynthesis anti-sigma factor FlgM [Chitinimonas sp.]MDN3576200.1 flagellar biosynthesis anti-sigma factor FlgM [Chitinimonas viridis]